MYVGKKEKWQRDGCVDAQGMFNASKVKAVFARLVRDAIRALQNPTGKRRPNMPKRGAKRIKRMLDKCVSKRG